MSSVVAAEPAKAEAPLEEPVDAGHSYHGEVFNEGPRQRAYLMTGTGHVDFPVTTSSKEAQAFVSQGLGQLYGFWYFEAERSFRQAISIDPECAMAYWGAAVANYQNTKRAKGFMSEAMKRVKSVTPRERMYLEAFNTYVNADPKKSKERGERYVEDLDKLLLEYPDDIEAKALLALQLYLNRSSGSKITSYFAIDALLGEVFAKQPLHSAHHFRIHLWDAKKPAKALESSALCGEGSPAIAHMWHMPGHIYSRLKRYNEAVWQQEASARVDHAHMMRDRVLPDQIHNFAHNNEWLIRNLMYVGRVEDAVSLARNMLELPRHPKYNTHARGSANYGRRRLTEVLQRYELHELAIELISEGYIEEGPTTALKMERLALLGAAHYGRAKGQAGPHLEQGKAAAEEIAKLLTAKRQEVERAESAARRKYLREQVTELALDDAKGNPLPPWESAPPALKDAQTKALNKAVADAAKAFAADIREMEKAERSVEGWRLAAAGDAKAAYEMLKKAGGIDTHLLARVQYEAGEQKAAIDAIKRYVSSHDNEVLPLATYIDLLHRHGEVDAAKEQFKALRTVGATLDQNVEVAQRMTELARDMELADDGADWREPFKPGKDFGERPSLDELGPFRWQPSPAPGWELSDADGKQRSLEDFRGRPVIAIFYLGYGCLHCAEQLQKFSPMKEKFAAAGIDLVAVSSDDVEGLQISIKDYKPGKLSFPLVADPKLEVFRKYRAFDDFEQQALHGTFLIDARGLVLWQDISYEPFMDAEFLLKEAPRLLKLQATRPSEGGARIVEAAK
ncbi:MAG: redoxin domain-containing protein [Planctomycetales bacterium]|nr:redoxin domain-containing protein [Planctomycetales bacterium]